MTKIVRFYSGITLLSDWPIENCKNVTQVLKVLAKKKTIPFNVEGHTEGIRLH